jgi:hypothetical protein
MILHESSELGDTFSVAEDGVLYRFAIPAPAQARPEPRPKYEPIAPLAALPALRDAPQPEKRSA